LGVSSQDRAFRLGDGPTTFLCRRARHERRQRVRDVPKDERPRRHYTLRVVVGLVPTIHVFHNPSMSHGYVYILTNRPNGILYVGVTNNLVRRVYEHRSGSVDGFTKRYGLKRLVYFERLESIRAAIQHEKNIKRWTRAWKVRKILAQNPAWDDLYETIT
jgi:putative endonuclease